MIQMFCVQLVLSKRLRERSNLMRTYYVNATNAEEAKARLLNHLEELGETRKTVRIFASPNTSGIGRGHVGTVRE